MANRTVNMPGLAKFAGATVNLASIIDLELPSGVLIDSVTLDAIRNTQLEEVEGELSITNIAKNSSVYTGKSDGHQGDTFAAGKVILFTASGGTAKTMYLVDFAVISDDGSQNPDIIRQPIFVG